ncbi:RUS family member 1 isoform X2 [Pongo pygmaeus]|uniref:C16orf58 isoform 7 n=1 Tax=Pongo abelii TaxID=9601 RepID=A0A2J8TL41_PONAB|nr:RUS family member 1 isoform X1 [Pongo abelii]PNJ33698.1 C16orf58 isoform 7 [Pongo abelii]
MADDAGLETSLCSEQFGSGEARGCRVAADGSLQWEVGGWRWWGLSRAFTVKPEGRDSGEVGAPGAPSPPLSGLQAVFLPQGFPDSVSPDYLPYQLWDSVQAFASSLSGSLATQAVLLGIGVGNAKATVSAATATWLVKDSTGMLGRIVFAWWKGSKLDCNAKQWRLFADILNDVAMFLEIMAPVYPICFTMTVSTSNLAKCIVSVAGGATRAALTVHQARRNNMADVSAKDSSQETLVNLVGLLVSLLMLPLVSGCPGFSLGCFFFLTALHIYANYRAVRALVMETLNEGRLRLVLKHYLQRGEVLNPTAANRMEPLWTDQVQVVLNQKAGPKTILRAATHGLMLGALQGDGPLPAELEELRNRVQAGPKKESWVIVKETHEVLDMLFPKFLKGLQDAGWKTEKHQLEVDEWRATWLLSPEKKVL